MRKLGIIIAFAVVAGVLAHRLVVISMDPPIGNGADIVWLKTEFKLTDEQFGSIRKLHNDYGAVCSRHCADIIDARADLQELRETNPTKTEIDVATERIQELETVCNDATREHLHRVAALMPASEGARFLTLVEPHLATAPHDGARFPSR